MTEQTPQVQTPQVQTPQKASTNGKTLLEVNDLKMYFPISKGVFGGVTGYVKAADEVSFVIHPGETLGLVGESGCGKTTVGRCLIRAYKPTDGSVLYRPAGQPEVDLAKMSTKEILPYRKDIRMIFQDPFSSLNPRMNVFEIVSEVLRVNDMCGQKEMEQRVAMILKQCGLRPEYMRRFPHAFSGGYVSTVVNQLIATSGGQGIDPAYEQQLRELYGLDAPMYVQYFKWIGNIITKGQFGYSFVYKRDTVDMIAERLPMTFALSFFSMIFVWAVAIPIGIYSAVRQYSVGDYIFTFIGFIGLAVPNFLLALILLFVSYKYLNQAMIGLFSPEFASAPWSVGKLVDMLKHLWIPVIMIGMSGTAGMIRTMRANLLDELNKPYVETARAKGLAENQLLLKYPVRHAMNPFISTIGWALPGLIAGEVIVSIVLNLPTSGPVLFNSLQAQDMYVAAGFIFLLSILTVIGTFISDVLLAVLDPRIRLQ